ncbi:hypothetical protein AX16_009361 [Volvariella volvacea WC 439]|nr:hypothetical protein AX16_009361 [Volvariella volvacea WC 439]
MDQQAKELARYLVSRLEQKLQSQPLSRLLVGIAGIPASGKSTFAQLLEAHVNQALLESTSKSAPKSSPNSVSLQVSVDEARKLLALLEHKADKNLLDFTDRLRSTLEAVIPPDTKAILVGLDGWHYTRHQLDRFADPKLAHDRRGAHWTFNGPSYVSFIQSLSTLAPEEGIPFPTFDHSLKDPSPSPHPILPHHRIIIIEGLYTLLSIDPWIEATKLLDERWLIKVDGHKARDRLIRRHVLTGVTKDLDEAKWRADENDGPSAH